MKEWFYAHKGAQQGPVTLEELRGLIRVGTLDPQTDLVWKSSMKDWLPAHQVAELIPAATADPANPYAPPTTQAAEETPLEEIPPGSQPIDVMACVKRGFDLTVRHFGVILLVGLVYIAITIAASFALGQIDSALGFKSPPSEFSAPGGESNFRVAFFYGLQQGSGPVELIFSQLISIFLSLGATRIGLNIVSGKPFNVGMLFSGGHLLVRAVGASILFYLMVGFGLVLLIVPGIYLALRFGYFLHAIVDRDLGVIDSLKYSSSITTNNRGNLFLLYLLGIAILFAGCLALGVGLAFAFPVFWLSWIIAYRWMQYGSRASMDDPLTKRPMLAGPSA